MKSYRTVSVIAWVVVVLAVIVLLVTSKKAAPPTKQPQPKAPVVIPISPCNDGKCA